MENLQNLITQTILKEIGKPKKPILLESIYRIGSEKHIEQINETRKLFNSNNNIGLHENDLWLIKETDAGEYGIYENQKVPLDIPFELLNESDKKPLNKPFRLSKEQKGKGFKKYGVYVKDGDKIKIVKFGHSDHKIKINNREASKNYASRHNCALEKDKTTPNWWSCNVTKYADMLNLSEPAYRYW